MQKHRHHAGGAALLGLLGLLAGACAEEEEAGGTCMLVGYWRAAEERLNGNCDHPEAVANDVLVRVTRVTKNKPSANGSESREFDLARGELKTTCSGTVTKDGCRLELSCPGGVGEEEVAQITLELDLTELGALSGRETLLVESSEVCRVEFRLEGERVSPLELPEGLQSLE